MPKKISSKSWIILLAGIGITFLWTGIASGDPVLLILSILFLLAALWFNQNEVTMGFDSKGVLLEKYRTQLHIPYEQIEWISEIKGRNMSICFMGFTQQTIFGTRVMFLTNGHKPIKELFLLAEIKGAKIRYVSVF